MKKELELHLIRRNSYFKWSTERLAERFNLSTRTVTGIINKLHATKSNYLKSLK